MIFGTVCSGIGAPEAAWTPLGWRCAFMSEIEAFPRAVLAHHYRGVPLHGDFTTIQTGDYEPIELLCGGTPCQSFSVAGLREGLADQRGNLALEYLLLAKRLCPRWIVFENVPGLRSSGDGRDFGAFLGGLGELGYGWAYRSLDAQYAGLAQRRERVFVVGYLGDWRPAAAVLFEPASLRGDPAPRRETGQRVARPIAAGSSGGSGYRNDADTADSLIAFGGNNTSGPIDVATALNASHTASGRQDFETKTFIAHTLRPPSHGAVWRGDGADNFIAHTLRAEGFDASEDGTGRGVPLVAASLTSGKGTGSRPAGRRQEDDTNLVPLGFDCRQDPVSGPIAGALGSSSPQAQAVAFAQNQRDEVRLMDVAGALAADPGAKQQTYAHQGAAVRRLTPRECERLQGFPDDYTLVPYRKGMAADGPRYRALGNSMAVPVVAWIGRRIEKIDAQMRAHMEQSA